MAKILGLVAAALLALGSAASAESLAGMVNGFGLIGTWSVDCKSPLAFRMILAEPPGGPPTHTTISFDGGVKTTVRSTVLAVARTGDQQVKLRLRIVGGDRDGGPLPSPTTNTFEVTIEKIGAARILLTGAGAQFLDRCRD
jgi:hypothetical protein